VTNFVGRSGCDRNDGEVSLKLEVALGINLLQQPHVTVTAERGPIRTDGFPHFAERSIDRVLHIFFLEGSMLYGKCSSSFGVLMAAAIATVCLSASAQDFVGGGNGPTYTTEPAVSIQDHSGEAGSREIIYSINGAGMDSKTTHASGSPPGSMSLFRGHTHANPGTAVGSHWGRYKFDQAYDLSNLWIWNWNEDPFNLFGWKHLTVEYSLTGGPNASDWTTLATDVFVPVGTKTAGMPASLILPMGGITAQYVVLTNVGFGAEENHSNGQFTNDAGLSEVRFEVVPVPEPASLTLLSLGGLALLRRRK